MLHDSIDEGVGSIRQADGDESLTCLVCGCQSSATVQYPNTLRFDKEIKLEQNIQFII